MNKLLIACFVLLTTGGFAQGVEMADGLRADGKIYVIVAIIMLVLGGLIAYLFAMDRKLVKMERLINEKEQTKKTR